MTEVFLFVYTTVQKSWGR